MNASWEVIVKWGDKFGSSYSRSWGEGFSLSFPLHQGCGEAFPNQQTLDAHPPLHFLFDGCTTVNDGDGYMTFATDEWCAALGAKILSIREYSRVSGALQVVQRPAWQDYFTTPSNIASRCFSFGESSIGTELGFTLWVMGLLSTPSGVGFPPTSNAVLSFYSSLLWLAKNDYTNLAWLGHHQFSWLGLIVYSEDLVMGVGEPM